MPDRLRSPRDIAVAGDVGSTMTDRCRRRSRACPAVATPDYDVRGRDRHRPSRARRVPSRAPGGVHRRVLAGDPRWGICGVSLKTPRAIEPPRPRRTACITCSRSSVRRHERARDRRRCARRCSPAPDAPRCGAARRSAPSTIVSLDRHREGLLPRSGDRRAQLRASGHRARPRASRRAASRRSASWSRASPRAAPRARDGSPFVCCDNLPHNGRMVEGLVHAFAQRRDPSLARVDRATTSRFPRRWSTASCPRPPTPTSPRRSAHARRARCGAGHRRALRQWVIEDRFAARAAALGRRRRAVRAPTSRRSSR